jgi:hypothetical protein
VDFEQPFVIGASIEHLLDKASNPYLIFSLTLTPNFVTPEFVEFLIYFDQMFESFVDSYVKGCIMNYIPEELLNDQQIEERRFLNKHITKMFTK